MSETPLEQLPNLGSISARQLGEVGIKTEAELRAVGAPAAFARLRQQFGRGINFNYLYALAGAIKGIRWEEMPENERLDLRVAAQAAMAPKEEPPAAKRARKKG